MSIKNYKPTPRTDDFAAQKIPANDFGEPKYHVALNNWAEFAQCLERELSEAIAANKEMGDALERLARSLSTQGTVNEIVDSAILRLEALKKIAGDGTTQGLMCDNDGQGCACVDLAAETITSPARAEKA